MGILSRCLGESRATVQALGHPRDPVIASFFEASSNTAAGVAITPETAMRVGAVYACVRVLAETMAALPLVVYRRRADGGKDRDPEHPLYALLHDKPNRRQTSFEFRETLIGHAALRGKAYARIFDDGNGRTTELIPMHPDRVLPFEAPDGRIAFRHTPINGPQQILLDNEVLYLPMLSSDGIEGLSPIALHRETIGLAMAAQQYGARFFGNEARPSFGLEVQQPLSPEAVKELRESWEKRHQGVENAHRLAVFDGGMKWVQIGMSHEDAQYLETRQFQVTDIARIFRMPPHKIGDLSRATFTNIEHQGIEFVTDALLPLVVRSEQRLNISLLTEASRRTHFIGFEMKGLLRGDSAARGEFYSKLFDRAALSPNDIRRLEDMNPYEGGDSYYVPQNMAPVDRIVEILMRDRPAAQTRLLNGSGDHGEEHHERH